MDELPGALGTSASLALRLGQAIFSVASLLFMCLDVEFYSYTSFWNRNKNEKERLATCVLCILKTVLDKMSTRVNIAMHNRQSHRDTDGFQFHCCFLIFSFLVTIMGLVIPWSLTLAMVDAFSVFVKRPSRQPGILSIVVMGDWVLCFLSLAASCSSASVTDLLIASGGSFCSAKLCVRYQLSAAMAFLSWFLSLASSLFNLWLLASL